MEPITSRSDLSADDILSASSSGPEIEIVDTVFRSASTSVNSLARAITQVKVGTRVSLAAMPVFPRETPYIPGPSTPRPRSVALTHTSGVSKEAVLLQMIIDNQDNIVGHLRLASDCIISSHELFTLIFDEMKKRGSIDEIKKRESIDSIKLLLFCHHWVDGNKDTDSMQSAMPKILEIIEYAKTKSTEMQSQAARLESALIAHPARRISAPEKMSMQTPVKFDQILQDLRKTQLAGCYDATVKKVAYDLTQKQIELFCRILPKHMISEKWRNTPSPIQEFTVHFDLVTHYFSDLIVLDPDADKRADLIKFFLDIARECIALNNYSTVASITAALNSASVGRLGETWQKVTSEKRYREQKEELDSLFSGLGSFRELREYMKRTSPSIPCFTILMQDMITYKEVPALTADNAFNFDKLRRVGVCLDTFFKDQERWQLSRDNDLFTTITDCISRHSALTEELRYKRSHQIESSRRGSVCSPRTSSYSSGVSSGSASEEQL